MIPHRTTHAPASPYAARQYVPVPTDVVFTHTGSALACAIAWFTRARGEPPTKATHAAPVMKAGYILNAKWRLPPRLTLEWWNGYRTLLEDGGGEWCIMGRTVEPSDYEECRWVWDGCMPLYRRGGYSLGEIGLHAIDGLAEKVAGRKVVAARLLGDSYHWRVICSRAAAVPCVAAGYLGESHLTDSPDDLLDAMEADDDWTLKARSQGWNS